MFGTLMVCSHVFIPFGVKQEGMGKKAFKHPFIRKKSLIVVVKGGRALRSSWAILLALSVLLLFAHPVLQFIFSVDGETHECRLWGAVGSRARIALSIVGTSTRRAVNS
jgi:hypothetical protein